MLKSKHLERVEIPKERNPSSAADPYKGSSRLSRNSEPSSKKKGIPSAIGNKKCMYVCMMAYLKQGFTEELPEKPEEPGKIEQQSFNEFVYIYCGNSEGKGTREH
jgi:hypothetical protein